MSTKPTLEQLRQFVGNPDVYAVQKASGIYTPVMAPLDDAVLTRHMLGEDFTVGTYIGHVNDDGVTVARTLCLDIDNENAEVAADDAETLVARLRLLGVPWQCIGVEDSGRRGRHVWVVLDTYRPNGELMRLGHEAMMRANLQYEVYPKQEKVRKLGNLVKLPGGRHQLGGPNNFLGDVPELMDEDAWLEVVADLPPIIRGRNESQPEEVRHPCMYAPLTEGIQEGARNVQLFHLATMLRRAGVPGEAVGVLLEYTNGIGDPVEDEELSSILDSSAFSGPICSQLPADRHCGDLCIMERSKGLSTRPGQLRHAIEGERVVVTIGERKGQTVELEHDDIMKARAVMRRGR